jgi:hypothetical protein
MDLVGGEVKEWWHGRYLHREDLRFNCVDLSEVKMCITHTHVYPEEKVVLFVKAHSGGPLVDTSVYAKCWNTHTHERLSAVVYELEGNKFEVDTYLPERLSPGAEIECDIIGRTSPIPVYTQEIDVYIPMGGEG